MAGHPDEATALLMRIWPAAVARAREEVADMQAIADVATPGLRIAAWDYRYYAERVRRAKFDLDPRRSGIEGVFDEFLDDRRRSLDHLPRRNLIGGGIVEDLDFGDNVGHKMVRTGEDGRKAAGDEGKAQELKK